MIFSEIFLLAAFLFAKASCSGLAEFSLTSYFRNLFWECLQFTRLRGTVASWRSTVPGVIQRKNLNDKIFNHLAECYSNTDLFIYAAAAPSLGLKVEKTKATSEFV